jgi:hypothetical protein
MLVSAQSVTGTIGAARWSLKDCARQVEDGLIDRPFGRLVPVYGNVAVGRSLLRSCGTPSGLPKPTAWWCGLCRGIIVRCLAVRRLAAALK